MAVAAIQRAVEVLAARGWKFGKRVKAMRSLTELWRGCIGPGPGPRKRDYAPAGHKARKETSSILSSCVGLDASRPAMPCTHTCPSIRRCTETLSDAKSTVT